MDPLTQAVLGGTIGEAGFRKSLGRKAGLFGAAVAMLPDLDVVTRLGGEWMFIDHHRASSHSLFTLSLAAFGIGALGYLWDRRRTRYRTWAHLSFWALVTHPLLDWCTLYGTELFWPLSRERLACDAVSVIDPIYSLPLFVAFIVGRMRSVSSKVVRSVAIAALALTTAYLACGYAQSRRAYELARKELEREQFPVTELRATPTPFNIWLQRLTARDAAGNLRVGFVSTWSPAPIVFLAIDRPASPLIDQALHTREGQIFLSFSQRMITPRVEKTQEGGARVILSDLRYNFTTAPRETPFEAIAEFDSSGSLTRMYCHRGVRSVGITVELAHMWRMIRGEPYDPNAYGPRGGQTVR